MAKPLETPIVRIAASAVALGERAVLIRGRSGAGKSSLALALVEEWRRQGDFARLVGDDRICVRICAGRALLSPHRAISGLVEWRGLGLLEQDFENCAVLALIVDLESEQDHANCPRLPEQSELCSDFHGLCDVPLLRLPARESDRAAAAVRVYLHKISTK